MAKPKTDQAAPASIPVTAPAPAVDEHAGQGGSYVMENGVRRLVERTQMPAPKPADNEGA
jgi:hypothetical protein